MSSRQYDTRGETDNFEQEKLELLMGENQGVDFDDSEVTEEFKIKREKLKDLKIVKHSWSLIEIYQKIKNNTIDLGPDYQREEVWTKKTQSQFIESLFIGIMIPPIYLAEIKPKKSLGSITYEVVDGKQRLTSIYKFFTNNLKLDNDLQYYGDIFAGKTFSEIEEDYRMELEPVLSSVIDMYVIAQNADPEIRYDVFARLNQGNIKLTQAELRKAIFSSEMTTEVFKAVRNIEEKGNFGSAFTSNDKKRNKDLNRMYQSIAYIEQLRAAQEISEENKFFKDYKSRPRDMINNVMQKFQNDDKSTFVKIDEIDEICNMTYALKVELNKKKYRDIEQNNELPNTSEYTIDSMIAVYNKYTVGEIETILDYLYNNYRFLKTFEKSPSTTSRVNERLKVVYDHVPNS
ncbi:DUF262 domain-containing protein [Bacillus sp. H-16]|uniref:GmrSD restriction endonuclease domain-containing protein n=1 Tax=Alteribacter salitolerans TaxID=2912333 RepID=UPI0019664BF8|nr:DUF262 domain-containing protein [Alteribacter salitolerans]MBM7094789.1 DUF262 domain-containing protein [Alteribacter salitolerans]